MLTKQNMMTATKDTLRDANICPEESALAFVTALRAYRYAAMAVGAAQNPFDAQTAARAHEAMNAARDKLNACVAAQIDDAVKYGG